MKRLQKLLIALLISISFCIPSLFAIFYYTKPMKDTSYDLSLLAEDGKEWKEDKGWTVYTETEEGTKELIPDETGGYTGIDYPGQTFYSSRRMSEELDSPMLQIHTANRTISVFLDEDMIYTDCPQLDNRVGYLTLPLLDYDRTEPVAVSLPPDYINHMLTIAQSSPVFSETQSDNDTVWPCEVTLYCGYSYESGLISDTAAMMIPSVFIFAIMLLLLGAFIWNASLGNLIPSLPVLALTAGFQMCSLLTRPNFFYRYSGMLPIDPSRIFFHLSVGTMLIFLTLYAGKLRTLFCAITVIHWISIIICCITASGILLPYGNAYLFLTDLPQLTGFLSIIIALVCSFLLWKWGSPFWRRMSKAVLFLTSGYILTLLFYIFFRPDISASILSRIAGEYSLGLPNYSLKLVWSLCLISSISAFLLELLEHETTRRTELAILSDRYELALESYENLQRHSEEVMMLRHDIAKHYTLIRAMIETAPDKVPGYLDELVGQVQNQRPVVTSGNQILDIIINGKINIAKSKGIDVHIIRTEAPKKLPLKDTETCCLIMNILDNAIHAATEQTSSGSFINLDFHCKENHFVFSCENSRHRQSSRHKKKSTTERGYGLKIIHQIMSQLGDMISIKENENTWQITIIIPLD